jgi:hypothetical protein
MNNEFILRLEWTFRSVRIPRISLYRSISVFRDHLFTLWGVIHVSILVIDSQE